MYKDKSIFDELLEETVDKVDLIKENAKADGTYVDGLDANAELFNNIIDEFKEKWTATVKRIKENRNEF